MSPDITEEEFQEEEETQHLDLSTDEWTALLSEAPVYVKKGTVTARQATAPEQITTKLANGIEETVNTAQPGDYIVTNPGGEQYVLKPENFIKRYEATEAEGIFRATGMVRAIQNPTDGSIEITAPWGEKQVGDSNCMIATPHDPQQPKVTGPDRYIIGYEEFQTTYVPYEDIYGPSDDKL